MLSDIRLAVRRLMRAPGFVMVVLLTLALSIGANTAIFSVVSGVLLRPPAVPDPDRVVVAWGVYPNFGRTSTSLPDYVDWRDGFARVGELAAFTDAEYTVTGTEAPERAKGAAVTANFFHVLGVAPALGRAFLAGEAQSSTPSVVMLGYEFWQRRYGGDRGVLGRTISLNGVPRTIVGVVPPGLEFPASPELLVPLRIDTTLNRRSEFLDVIGRLAPGVTIEQARATLAGTVARLARDYPETNATLESELLTLHEQLVGPARRALLVLMGAVGLVLLVACANVANLLLARSATRTREVALAAALGAARGRVIRQLLVESIVLAMLGGAVGVGLASLGLRALKASQGAAIPRLETVQIDGRVLAFAIAVSVATGLLFGVAPALRLAADGLQSVLRAGGRSLAGTAGSRRTREVLVAGEVALAVVLLVGSGLLLQSFARLLAVQPGFDATRVLTATVAMPRPRYTEDARVRAVWDDVLARVRATPGVRAASVSSSVPLTGSGYWSVDVEGEPARAPNDPTPTDAQPNAVSDDFFRTMGIGLVRGRTIDARDVAGSPAVAVINETMAKQRWPNGDPIGARVRFDSTWRTVVGIVRDTRQEALGAQPYPQLYYSAAQRPARAMYVAIRTAGDPTSAAAVLRAAVKARDPELPVYDVRTLEQLVGRSVARPRVTAALVTLFAAVALALATVGIYGVVAYTVSQRARELGVRMALGARGADVVRLVVAQGVAPVIGGLLLGLGAALAASRVLSSLLFGVSATDPISFAGVALFLGAVALLAAYLPARRATRVDPAIVLAGE